jgi:hypothetical protein
MKLNIYAFFIVVCICFISSGANAQGCVAVKNMASCTMAHDTEEESALQISANYRYFRSYKHFRGAHEEKARVERGTEVINNDNSLILGVAYNINKKWSVSAAVPFIWIDRSSLYEHYGNPPNESAPLNPRFHTQATGFGDVRLSAYYAAIANEKLRLSLGLGVKLPTGNFRVQDEFHRRGSEGQDSTYTKVVDQSIQLGDGGWGFSPEFDLSVRMSKKFGVYATGLYLLNPRNTNGVKRSNNLTDNIPLSNEFSVADQYLLRAGVSYNVKKIQVSLGGRYEGVASEDLIGESDGWRRPGYVISLEPSVAMQYGPHTWAINLPFALKRNRVQNTIDKTRTQTSGTYTIGDAAFADWLLSFTYAYRFAKS